jgi:hypothetical protein
MDEGYDRGRLALYLAGLLPDDLTEAQAVLSLIGRLLLTLQEGGVPDKESD